MLSSPAARCFGFVVGLEVGREELSSRAVDTPNKYNTYLLRILLLKDKRNVSDDSYFSILRRIAKPHSNLFRFPTHEPKKYVLVVVQANDKPRS